MAKDLRQKTFVAFYFHSIANLFQSISYGLADWQQLQVYKHTLLQNVLVNAQSKYKSFPHKSYTTIILQLVSYGMCIIIICTHTHTCTPTSPLPLLKNTHENCHRRKHLWISWLFCGTKSINVVRHAAMNRQTNSSTIHCHII